MSECFSSLIVATKLKHKEEVSPLSCAPNFSVSVCLGFCFFLHFVRKRHLNGEEIVREATSPYEMCGSERGEKVATCSAENKVVFLSL